MELDSTAPIYKQIAADVRHQILIRALTDGDRVMSTTQYATSYRINPATAAKAFAQLIEEGLLVKRRGLGMFVAEGARDRLIAAEYTGFIDQTFSAVVRQAFALGIDANTLIEHIRAISAEGATDQTKE
ncbi:GntR family transcriptional regulator [Actinomyces sp.]|uniref:GntR family transcriptional regulator n=1 Tax=Actinomyces sp. TaxID=29317 RepID=UPI0026DC5F63|nr:GntR family transcriptional regulator [Actinomyces sp.]MDO4901252.1 GntR family transcriptional regulator [Actinomyces sp.]